MESGQESTGGSADGESTAATTIADMDSLLDEARRLVAGTDAIFEKNGLSRDKLSEIAVHTGVAALGAQIRKEEAAATAPKRAKKKKAKRARVRL